MANSPNSPKTVEEYFTRIPAEHAERLEAVREVLHRAIPGATERIGYGMPCLELPGRANLHFAAWKQHVGIYPVGDGDLFGDLATEAEPFRKTANMLAFKHKDPLPLDLIERIAGAIADHSGALVDEQGRESFPASDPPANY
jgi:uncharacterized protein YdhG (YjbR/CyaY superfamily)